MRELLSRLLHPLNFAGLVTWLTVFLMMRRDEGMVLGLLIAWIVTFFAASAARRPVMKSVFLAVEALIALVLLWFDHGAGVVPILLVVFVAQLSVIAGLRVALSVAVLVCAAEFLLLKANGHANPLPMVLSYGGFQLFAILTAHYARTAEQSRDRMAAVNADLLATRALLADSARINERLRLARELHDVAGHQLTALQLNLRAQMAAAPSPELETSRQIAADLMQRIREVVHAMRDPEGLNLDISLRALAGAYPRPVMKLDIAQDLRIDDTNLAETVLRTVQEALTNAARHGAAATLWVHLSAAASRVQLRIEDDGAVRFPLREGHGLIGMRERIASLGGTLVVGPSPHGGVRLLAEFPQ